VGINAPTPQPAVGCVVPAGLTVRRGAHKPRKLLARVARCRRPVTRLLGDVAVHRIARAPTASRLRAVDAKELVGRRIPCRDFCHNRQRAWRVDVCARGTRVRIRAPARPGTCDFHEVKPEAGIKHAVDRAHFALDEKFVVIISAASMPLAELGAAAGRRRLRRRRRR